MTTQYFVIRFLLRGELKTMLLNFEEYKDHIKDGDHKKGQFSFYLPPEAEEIQEKGIVQMMGDIDELDPQYISD